MIDNVVYNLFGDFMSRIIFHIDVNNAFLSWTAVKLLNEGFIQDFGARESRT